MGRTRKWKAEAVSMVSMKSHRPGHEDGLSTAILLHCLGEHFSFSPGRAVHGHTPSPTHAGTPTLALAVLVALAFVGQLLSPPMLRSFWSFVVLVPLCELTAPPGASAVATSAGRLRRAWRCIRRPAQQPYSSQSRPGVALRWHGHRPATAPPLPSKPQHDRGAVLSGWSSCEETGV